MLSSWLVVEYVIILCLFYIFIIEEYSRVCIFGCSGYSLIIWVRLSILVVKLLMMVVDVIFGVVLEIMLFVVCMINEVLMLLYLVVIVDNWVGLVILYGGDMIMVLCCFLSMVIVV